MKLVGAITQGSGSVNEDGYGFVGTHDAVSAAWIFDGVTGINSRSYLPGGSDAAWFVARANQHLCELAKSDLSLKDILTELVARLISEWQHIAPTLDLPAEYDPPAACVTMVKNYAGQWHGMRLGDSCLFADHTSGSQHRLIESPNNEFDNWLSEHTKKRRAEGVTNVKQLLAEFRPQLIAARKTRNKPGGYSILEAHPAALNFPEFVDLGNSDAIMLCTDGYYRAVDHYELFTADDLFAKSLQDGGVEDVLQKIRDAEASDPECLKYLRFKPADDATALVLKR